MFQSKRKQVNFSHNLIVGFVAVFFALMLFNQVGAVPIITATKTDTHLIDADNSGGPTPGDTLEYAIVINNSGTTDATNIQFSDTLDTNTTLVPGSLAATPIARNDSYAATGNVRINVPAGSGVLANDNDPDGSGAVTVDTSPATTTQGGTLAVASDGSFTYDPPPGFTGNDSFTYTIQDVDTNQDSASVAITVADMIWFIDNSYGGSPSDGRSATPFNSVSAFEAVNGNGGTNPAAEQSIFLHTGNANYTGPLTLENQQILIGQGATDTIANISGITFASHSVVPAASGTHPVIVTNSITVAQDNTIRGLNIGNTGSNVGIKDSGTVGTLNISELSITGTGGGVQFINGGTLSVSINELSSSGSSNEGIHLNGVGGSFDTTSGIINTTNIPGVLIDGNPLQLGVTLTGVSTNGGNNGIFIKDTTGSFTVTGTGSAGTGGTIKLMNSGGNGTTNGIGVYLNNSADIELNDMQLNDFSNFAIRGINAAGFTLADSVINGSNGNSAGDDEGSVSFDNLTGTASFSNNNISGGLEDNIVVTNNTGTLNMSVTGGTIGLNSNALGNDGILVESQSSATLNLSVTGASFLGARGDMIQCNAIGNSTMDCTIRDNTFNNTHGNSLGGGITISGGGAGSNFTLTYDVSGTNPGDQTFRDAVASAIAVNFVNGDGTANGFIRNNHIGVTGVTDSGSSGGHGISLGTNVDVKHQALVDGNTIRRIKFGNGIDLNASNNVAFVDGDGLYATVTNNTIEELESLPLAAVYVISGGAGAADTSHMCADIKNNSIDLSNGTFAFSWYIDDFGAASSYNFPGYGGPLNPGSGTQILTFLDGQNTVTGGFGGAQNNVQNVTGTGTNCPLPVVARNNQEATDADNTAVAHAESKAESVSVAAVETQFSVNKTNQLAKSAAAPQADVNVDLGTLNPGQQVTLTFQATIDAQPPIFTQVCNQGVITADNNISVVTDDPDTAASNDPTCTTITPPQDWGDLPDSYATSSPTGASHITSGPYLGNCLDAEISGVPSADALADNAIGSPQIGNCTNPNDEDGVSFANANNWSFGNGRFDVTVNNGDSCLNAWLDFTNGTILKPTGDGDFNDSLGGHNEHIVVNMPVSSSDSQPIAVNFTLPNNAADNASLYLRVRLTERDNAGACNGFDTYAAGTPMSDGHAFTGEVEDYQVSFTPTAISLLQVTHIESTSNLVSILILLGLVFVTVYGIWKRFAF